MMVMMRVRGEGRGLLMRGFCRVWLVVVVGGAVRRILIRVLGRLELGGGRGVKLSILARTIDLRGEASPVLCVAFELTIGVHLRA